MAVTRKYLERLPEAQFGWRPHAKQQAAVLRFTVFSHTIHHRAQLGVYLRMHDVALPSTYGPSADEQPF